MRELLFFLIFLPALFLTSCGTGIMTVNGGYKNSIYYTSEDVLPVNVVVNNQEVAQVEVSNEETYEEKLHKFDRLTYTINLSFDPWYPTYYWRWNRWYLSPYVYTSIYWDWSWRPYYYYDYWGYYNPYRYSYRYYYPYRSYWDWHRPYYTYYHHKPSHRPGRDVYYTRRGGMSGPTPSHRAGSTSRSNRTVYRPSSSRPRQATFSRDNNPTRRATVSRSGSSSRNATVSRSGSQPRQATTSRKTNVRYNNSARPVSRNQSQTDRTGYSRSTTNNRSSNTGRTYYNNNSSSQRTQPSVRYSERNTSSQNSGVSHSSSGGSSTRRK